jgi:tetratricopeptide (TPR) repeat protein
MTSQGKTQLRTEMLARIKEAVEAKDWPLLDSISRRWIEMDPTYPAGFKWQARASVALGHTVKAAYAYGRYLDFDKNFEEAKKFFRDHPSSLDSQPESIRQTVGARVNQYYNRKDAVQQKAVQDAEGLTFDQRQMIAEQEFILAEIYKKFHLYVEAAEHYLKSHEWLGSKSAALGHAECLHRQSRGNEAVRFLRDQLYSNVDWNEGRLMLGKILFDVGLRNEAQKEWQIVLDYDPNNKEALTFLRNLLAYSM